MPKKGRRISALMRFTEYSCPKDRAEQRVKPSRARTYTGSYARSQCRIPALQWRGSPPGVALRQRSAAHATLIGGRNEQTPAAAF